MWCILSPVLFQDTLHNSFMEISSGWIQSSITVRWISGCDTNRVVTQAIYGSRAIYGVIFRILCHVLNSLDCSYHCCSVIKLCLFVTGWTATCPASLYFTISRVCSNSRPLWQLHHPTISSSVTHFCSCPQSFPESGYFQRVGCSHQVAKVLELQL